MREIHSAGKERRAFPDLRVAPKGLMASICPEGFRDKQKRTFLCGLCGENFVLQLKGGDIQQGEGYAGS